MLNEIIKNLNLPELKSRDEMLDILFHEEYGYLPEKPDKISFSVHENTINNFCAGKANANKVDITVSLKNGEFTFPIYTAIPNNGEKHPFFVMINFRDNVPDLYMPTEELIDNGFAVISFCYKDVTSDNDDFTNGLAGVIYNGRERQPSDCGKIAMWAWAAQRAMDYAETLDCLDFESSVVCGHSRLGKTAMLCGAVDERFKYIYSNNSGCGGAAVTRNKCGETVKDICRNFSYWFCKNYQKYIDNESSMPFDQHFLAALAVPRKLFISSASEDLWADPKSEFLNCIAAGKAYEAAGMTGFKHDDRFLNPGEYIFTENIGYSLRPGLHYLSRADWNRFIEFFKFTKK